MKAIVSQSALSRALATVGRAVATRPTLPVLSNILIASDGGRLLLAGTDLETFLTLHVAAKVEGEGALTVPARLVVDLVNSLPDQSVTLEIQGDRLRLTCGRHEAEVKGLDADEFPLLPDVGEETQLALPPDLLREMISQVVFAAAHDESRPVLAGVLARFEGDKLTMAAADGFRLAVREATLSEAVRDAFSVVIPAKALNELVRVSGDEEERISLHVTDAKNQIQFRMVGDAGANEGRIYDIALISQLIEGRFVNYEQIIPKSHQTRTTLDRGAFLRALKTANVYARHEANNVTLDVRPGESVLLITASGLEMGDTEIEVDVEAEGDEVKIAFDVRYLTDAVGAVSGDRVVLETVSGTRPGVIRPAAGDGYTCVVMPMAIRGE